MRALYISILLLMFAITGAGCLHTHSGDSTYVVPASIEIKRPENNGSINILPCTISFSDGQKCELSGGERKVVSVRSGALWAAASSPDPYRLAATDSPAWRFAVFRFNIRPGETLRLSVEPKPKKSTHVG